LIVVYNKFQDLLAREIEQHLSREGIPWVEVRYGSYTTASYHTVLEEAMGLIWLSRSETQGFAVLEAMSMNVPILAWDCGTWEYKSLELNRAFSAPASSVPYFDSTCGERFTSLEDFYRCWTLFKQNLGNYKPRDFIFRRHLDLASNLAYSVLGREFSHS
jgi:hypothetical protein